MALLRTSASTLIRLVPTDARGVSVAPVASCPEFAEARALYSEAFFGMTVPEAIKTKARTELLAGIALLGRHGKFAPFVAGEALSVADIYFLYSVSLACAVGHKLFGLDLLADMPGAKALLARLEQNPHVQKIAADKEAVMPQFLAWISSKK